MMRRMTQRLRPRPTPQSPASTQNHHHPNRLRNRHNHLPFTSAAAPPPLHDRTTTCRIDVVAAGRTFASSSTSQQQTAADEQQHNQRQEHRFADVVSGTVVSHRANFVNVRLQAGTLPPDGAIPPDGPPPPSELLCVTRQVLKKVKQTVLVGDRVEVGSVDWVLGRGVVESVLPRRSLFQTPSVANVDTALLMFSLKDPPIDPHQVSRFLVTAEAAKLPGGVTVVLNKTDIVPEDQTSAWIARLREWGYDALPVSARGGIGVEAVCDALRGRLGVIVGPSGAGKSSLINAINAINREGPPSPQAEASSSTSDEADEEEELAVGAVSGRTGRGMHTTTNISLIRLRNGGLLADTPGFNQPTLAGLTSLDLPGCFPEIGRALAAEDASCSFANCTHVVSLPLPFPALPSPPLPSTGRIMNAQLS